MNKKELIDAVADAAGIAKSAAEQAINGMQQVIGAALAEGDSVVLTGFGTFSVADRPARTGVNPRTGEKLNIAARKAVKFKAGKNLAESLN
jgi:DNA-binding protein HU-beta